VLEEETDNRGFKLLHKNERWIIYNLTGLEKKNWRGGFSRESWGGFIQSFTIVNLLWTLV